MSSRDTGTNIRRYPRLQCFVGVELHSEEPELFVFGTLASIGLGGCGVETNTPVEIGVRVEIASVENQARRVSGVVVNQRVLNDKPGFGIGVQFNSAAEQINDLVKFVESKTQMDNQEHRYLTQLRRTEEENP
jgi:hypothetical protein